MNLTELRDATRHAWPFTQQAYPAISNLSDEQRQAFALKHVLVHMIKATGQISSTIEPLDHGGLLNREQLLSALRNLIVQSIQCADLAGISEKEVERDLSKWRAGIEKSLNTSS